MRKFSLAALILALCVLAATLYSPIGVDATSPGLITSLSGTGLTNIANQVLPMAIAAIKEMPLDNVSADHLTISSLRIPNLGLRSFSIGTTGNQIFLNLSNLDVTVKGHARYKYLISVSADFTASATGSGTIACALVPSGDRFIIQLTQADIQVSDFSIRISGGIVAKVLNAIKSLFSGIIRRNVTSRMSAAIREAIVEVATRMANSLPNSFQYGAAGHVLSLAPAAFGARYDNNSVSVAFNASVDGFEPERHGIDENFAPTGALFDIFVDVFVFNSGFSAIPFKVHNFDKEHPGSLPVPGWTGKDWALVIPIMALKFPNDPVRVELTMLEAPVMSSAGGQLSLQALGGVRIFAGETQVALISADMRGGVTVALTKDSQGKQFIIPQLQQVGVKFTIVESISGDIMIVGVLESILNFLVNVSTGIINTVMLQGILVPSVNGVEFINPRIDFPPNAIRFGTDISYTPPF